jgi:ParB family chromosome partitioning protein
MAKTTFEAQRFSGFVFEPEFIVIIGHDTKDGPEHPLYDERIFLPLDEGMVLSIMAIGVREPVSVTKGFDDRPVVVDGRRRVLHAREANKRLRKQGEPLIKVRAVAESGSEEYLSHVSVALNEIRVQDGVLVKAQKAGRMLARGHSEADVAIAFGVSTASVRAWQKLEELPAPVKKAVSDGVLSANAASKLHGLPREEALQKLEELKGEHAQTGKKATARKVDKGDGRTRPAKKALESTLKWANKAGASDVSSEYFAGVQDALRFALGYKDALQQMEAQEEEAAE